jgi:hypothetical protein
MGGTGEPQRGKAIGKNEIPVSLWIFLVKSLLKGSFLPGPLRRFPGAP